MKACYQSLLDEFVEQVEHRFERDRPASFAGCEPAFRCLIDRDWVAACLREALSGLRERPFDKGDWTANQLIVFRGRGYAVSITLFEQSTRYIHTAPFFAMYAPIGGRPLAFDRYRLPSSYQNAVFDPLVCLEPAGSGQVECGNVLNIGPDDEVHDFRIDSPQLVLKFTSSAWHFLEWLFDRDSLRAVQANDAALSTTQLRVASYLLGRLGHPTSIEPLKQLSDHRIPNIRWAAIQNLGRLSAEAAIGPLEKAVADPHPHIRRAAQKSLARMKPPIEPPGQG